MIIETTTPEESAKVFADAKAGRLHILRMAKGKTGNASWIFDVTPQEQPELIPIAVGAHRATKFQKARKLFPDQVPAGTGKGHSTRETPTKFSDSLL